MSFEIIDCAQGGQEWFNLRMGIPTASNFQELLVTPRSKGEVFGKGAMTYMYKLAGERLMGEVQQNGSNIHMERGKENEPRARVAYYFATGRDVKQTGIIIKYNDIGEAIAGYSPDGLVGNDGLIEIKDRLPHIQIETILKNETPRENMAQMQGGLWISEREWCDYVSYCPRLLKPFIKRVNRDEKMISLIAQKVDIFNNELFAMCEKLKKWELES